MKENRQFKGIRLTELNHYMNSHQVDSNQVINTSQGYSELIGFTRPQSGETGDLITFVNERFQFFKIKKRFENVFSQWGFGKMAFLNPILTNQLINFLSRTAK